MRRILIDVFKVVFILVLLYVNDSNLKKCRLQIWIVFEDLHVLFHLKIWQKPLAKNGRLVTRFKLFKKVYYSALKFNFKLGNCPKCPL